MAMIVLERWRTADSTYTVRRYLASPVGKRLPTMAPTPRPVCPICSQLEGLIFARGTGPEAPLHPYCRCERVPVTVYDPDRMTPEALLQLGVELERALSISRTVVPHQLIKESTP